MKHIKEKWKDIIGYEGYYKVSNLGNILSLNYKRTGHPQLLSLRIGHKRNNYVDVMLTKNGKQKRYKIHRLVAEAFIPNPNNYPQVNHKDCNPLNNKVDNLEWCNAKYNINYSDRSIKFGKTVGCKVIQYSLKGEEIETFYSIGEAARITGLHKTNIYDAVSGKQKTCGGYIWKKAI